jgi:CMP-N,N'-diacetyllegionaminic acid synthase
MFILGVVPARGNSKGIKGKNLFLLCGKPLIEYTLEAAKFSHLDDIILTTDSLEIAEHWYPSKTIMRPPELAQDDTPMLPVIRHAVREYEISHDNIVDIVVTLQPTSPLRVSNDINKAIDMFIANDNESLVSVYEGIHPIKSYTNEGEPFFTQEAYDKHAHKCWTRNGAIFITRRNLLDKGKLYNDKPLLYIMPFERSIDIDSMNQMLVAESLLISRNMI